MTQELYFLYILSRVMHLRVNEIEALRQQYGSFEAGCLKHQAYNSTKVEVSYEVLREQLMKYNINILPYFDRQYPIALRTLPEAPPLLFYRGTLGDPEELCVGVVGTRKVTQYGQLVTPIVVSPLAQAGVTVVSGLAYGVDALAHQAVVNQGKRTIAVLPSGLDPAGVYPRHHQYLAEQIVDCGGLLLSEHIPGTPGFKHHFLERNRIISGLSIGVAVIECAVKSGAMITARYAVDQGRQVYAVPGNITAPYSAGPNLLLQRGAFAITRGEDIIEDLGLQINNAITSVAVTTEQQRVLEYMQSGPVSFDELMTRSGLENAALLELLTELELNGVVETIGQGMFIKI